MKNEVRPIDTSEKCGKMRLKCGLNADGRNKPITVEQLREMDGQPVWVKVLDTRFNEENQWAICNAEYQMVTLKDGFKLFFCGYESNWLAYAYPPAHIDREAWERCWTCRWVVSQPNWRSDYKFCPRCGKPLTEEAWAELEKRMGLA